MAWSWKNWKTGTAGVATIALGVTSIVSGGPSDQKSLTEGIAAILAGIGLFAAKDANVTGGTTPATPEAEKRIAGK